MFQKFRNKLLKTRLLFRVIIAKRDGNESAVFSNCHKILEIDPNDLSAFKLLAKEHKKNDNVDQAIYFSMKVLDQSPKDFDMLELMARIQIDQKNYKSTYNYAQRTLVFLPKDMHLSRITIILGKLLNKCLLPVSQYDTGSSI